MAGNIAHYGAIRLRVTGSGNLNPTFYSMDKVDSSVLVPIVMTTPSARDMTRLGNFTSNYLILRLDTTAIDEVFRINRITVFAKPLWSEYPG